MAFFLDIQISNVNFQNKIKEHFEESERDMDCYDETLTEHLKCTKNVFCYVLINKYMIDILNDCKNSQEYYRFVICLYFFNLIESSKVPEAMLSSVTTPKQYLDKKIENVGYRLKNKCIVYILRLNEYKLMNKTNFNQQISFDENKILFKLKQFRKFLVSILILLHLLNKYLCLTIKKKKDSKFLIEKKVFINFLETLLSKKKWICLILTYLDYLNIVNNNNENLFQVRPDNLAKIYVSSYVFEIIIKFF